MGALVGLLPALTAGGAAAGTAASSALSLGTIMTGVSAGASVLGGLASMSQGKAEQNAADIAARQLELQGRMDAVSMNKELLQTLALNDVAAASSGLASAGTPMYAKQQSMQNANEELRIQRLNTSVKKAEAEQKGDAAMSKGLFGMAAGVMTAGDRIGSSLSEKAKTKK